MKMNKVLIKLGVPLIEKEYEVWIPTNKKVYDVINLLVKAINELNIEKYNTITFPMLYDKISAQPYDSNLSIKEAKIKNGTELILI